MKTGDKVNWTGKAGTMVVEFRGRIGSDACIICDGMQWMVPVAELSAISQVNVKPAVGDIVKAGGEIGIVEEVQGMFYLVRVDGKVHHYHRSEVRAV